MKTFASVFTGGGGADIGLIEAGLEHLWGIEYDAKIAQVANDNIGGVICADILEVEPSTLNKPDWLHMSPPCPNFSTAKTDGEETTHDIALAEKCAEFVTTLRPKVVSLENVRAYEKSKSWQIIYDAMVDSGYTVQWSIINMADFGVPQKRIRMIAAAILGNCGLFMPPPQTHHKKGGLFWKRHESVAIEPKSVSHITERKAKAFEHIPNGAVIDNKRSIGFGIRYTMPGQTAPVLTTDTRLIYKQNSKYYKLSTDDYLKIATFPLTYQTPSNAMCKKITGNAVPPLFMKKLANHILNKIK